MGIFDGLTGGGAGGVLGNFNTKLGGFVDKNPMALMAASSALLSGDGWGGGMRGFMQGGMMDTQNRRMDQQDKMAEMQFQQQNQLFDQQLQDRRQQQEERNKTQAFIAQKLPQYADAPREIQMAAVKSLFTGQKPTSDIQEYEYARQNDGFEGSFMDFQTSVKNASAPKTYAAPPPGYMQNFDDQGRPVSMEPIPGGPAAMEAAKAQDVQQEALSNAMTQTDVITSAAQRAREAAKERALGGIGQGIVQLNPYTDAAEVARQVEVLQSQAKIENLNQMRRMSPTGGALGNVTEKESAMLAAKSGALDPSSPYFERDLADYERTLLRTVHGREMGDKIFEAKYGATQKGGGGYRILGVE